MQDAHNVWVAGKPPHRALLTYEAGQILFVMVGAKDFDRDSAIQAGFDAPIDSTEPALPDQCDLRKARSRQLRDDRIRVGTLGLCRICGCHQKRSHMRWVPPSAVPWGTAPVHDDRWGCSPTRPG